MKLSKKKLGRQFATALFSGMLMYLFYISRPELSAIHRFWRATGDVGFVLLFMALLIGPLSKIWRPAAKLIPWRRPLGIWFAIVALIHSYSIFDGWIRWDWLKFLGYEFIPQLNRYARMEPGFGLANVLGLIALFWALVLAVTSSDKALRYLGDSTWKWIQNFAYVIFYLTGAHAMYFLFVHFTQSFHNNPFPPNWFRYYAVAMVVTLFTLQISAFVKSIMKRNRDMKTDQKETIDI